MAAVTQHQPQQQRSPEVVGQIRKLRLEIKRLNVLAVFIRRWSNPGNIPEFKTSADIAEAQDAAAADVMNVERLLNASPPPSTDQRIRLEREQLEYIEEAEALLALLKAWRTIRFPNWTPKLPSLDELEQQIKLYDKELAELFTPQ